MYRLPSVIVYKNNKYMSYGIYTEHTTTIWDTFYVYFIFLSDLNPFLTQHMLYTHFIYTLHIYKIRKRSKFMSYVGTPSWQRTRRRRHFIIYTLTLVHFSFCRNTELLKSLITVYPKSYTLYGVYHFRIGQN